MSSLAALGSRIPPPLRTVRFRIAFLTAGSLVVLAGLVVGAFHLTISATLEDEQRLNELARPGLVAGEDGRLLRTNTLVVADAVDLERAATARTLRTIRDVALGALGVLFVFSLGVAWLVTGRFLRPLDEMASTVRRIEATTLSQRLALEGPEHELKRLADAVDGLLARLESAFALQRRYVAEASHELRNPLAVIRTNLDVALAEQHGPADNLRSHANVALRATDRMAGILRDLLAVSRLEAPGSRNREVDLAEVAAEVGDELDALAALRGLVIVRRLAPGLCVAGDREALKRALANLLDNAVRLAPGGSRDRDRRLPVERLGRALRHGRGPWHRPGRSGPRLRPLLAGRSIAPRKRARACPRQAGGRVARRPRERSRGPGRRVDLRDRPPGRGLTGPAGSGGAHVERAHPPELNSDVSRPELAGSATR